jgi:flagellar biosynthesis protein FliQ
MTPEALYEVSRQGLFLVLLLSAPVLAVALATNILTGLLAHYTRLSEPAVGNVARMIAVLGALLIIGPWIGGRLVSFAQSVWHLLIQAVS